MFNRIYKVKMTLEILRKLPDYLVVLTMSYIMGKQMKSVDYNSRNIKLIEKENQK
ncbi:MAG: hypothetical protein Q9M36_07635 [Sulfurovum sp.]|nr:hypothetical protein [Sulfurovum sp.]